MNAITHTLGLRKCYLFTWNVRNNRLSTRRNQDVFASVQRPVDDNATIVGKLCKAIDVGDL